MTLTIHVDGDWAALGCAMGDYWPIWFAARRVSLFSYDRGWVAVKFVEIVLCPSGPSGWIGTAARRMCPSELVYFRFSRRAEPLVDDEIVTRKDGG